MVKDKTKSWRYSPEKKLLLQWLEDGEVGQDDSPRQAYLMNEGFWQFKYEKQLYQQPSKLEGSGDDKQGPAGC